MTLSTQAAAFLRICREPNLLSVRELNGITPLGVHFKKVKTLADPPDGALIAIPNDPANGARSLLLDRAGLIKLTPGAGTKATVPDIVGNPRHLRFRELDAAQVARSLDDVSTAAVNFNYAIPAEFDPRSALVKEGNETVAGCGSRPAAGTAPTRGWPS